MDLKRAVETAKRFLEASSEGFGYLVFSDIRKSRENWLVRFAYVIPVTGELGFCTVEIDQKNAEAVAFIKHSDASEV